MPKKKTSKQDICHRIERLRSMQRASTIAAVKHGKAQVSILKEPLIFKEYKDYFNMN